MELIYTVSKKKGIFINTVTHMFIFLYLYRLHKYICINYIIFTLIKAILIIINDL